MAEPTKADVERAERLRNHIRNMIEGGAETNMDALINREVTAEFAAVREEAWEEASEHPVHRGCVEVVAELNRRFGATTYADAIAAVEQRIAEARAEGRREGYEQVKKDVLQRLGMSLSTSAMAEAIRALAEKERG